MAEENAVKETTDLSTMSDDEIMAMDESDIYVAPSVPDEEEDNAAGDGDPAGSADEADEDQDNPDDDTGGADDDEDSSDKSGDSDDPFVEDESSDTGSGDGDEDTDKTPKADQAEDKVKSEESKDDQTDDEQTFKAKYDELMAPFKAAKRMVTVGSIDDARALMQKGVDYSRKMELMKPHQRVLRTLEKAGLTDPSRINFLIDLDKKDPEAIKKLLKDSDIDPMQLNLEGSENYKPNDHTIGDKELSVREALDNIKDDPGFDRTYDVITKELDQVSRTSLQERPDVITELHNHIEAGVYDKVQERVANERVFGRLKGLSDLEAYYTVGDMMFKAGELGNQPPESNDDSAAAANDKPTGAAQGSGSQAKRRNKPTEAELRNRKSAAGTPRGRQQKGGKKIPDFSKMTDKEIEELDISSF